MKPSILKTIFFILPLFYFVTVNAQSSQPTYSSDGMSGSLTLNPPDCENAGWTYEWTINVPVNTPIKITYTNYIDCYLTVQSLSEDGTYTAILYSSANATISTSFVSKTGILIVYCEDLNYVPIYDEPVFNLSFTVDNTYSSQENTYTKGNSIIDGKLGIGVQGPLSDKTLDVAGNARISASNKNQTLYLSNNNNSGTTYGLYNSATSTAASYSTYGIYSDNRNRSTSAGTVYGLYNYSSSSNSLTGNLYGIYSSVSGGKNRWSGYFYGGDLEVKNGNIKTSGYLYGGNILTFMDNARFTVTSTQIPTLTISSFSMPQYGIGTPNASGSAETWISGNAGIRMFTAGNVIPRLSILNSGNVGIGTITPDALLTVNGTIHAKEVKVDLTGSLADYVFSPDYKLMPLSHVESFVKTNSHLPYMPSAEEVEENGLNMGEMQNKLLQKVEELTLYAIQQQKQIIELQKQVDELKSRK